MAGYKQLSCQEAGLRLLVENGLMFINEYGFRQLVRECNVNSADKAKTWLLKEMLPWALQTVKEEPNPDEIIAEIAENI